MFFLKGTLLCPTETIFVSFRKEDDLSYPPAHALMPNRSSTRWKLLPVVVLLGGMLFVTGCEQVESIQSRFERSLTPHEQYAVSLEQAGLTTTALGRSWIDASTVALVEASPVDLPFREARFGMRAPASVFQRFRRQKAPCLPVRH